MARANVPKFGNWEGQDNMPFTVCFENARKARGGKMINPNDPQENPDLFRDPSLLAPAPTHTPPSKSKNRSSQEPTGRRAVRPAPDHGISREESEFKQFNNSPARTENMGQRTAADQSNYGGRGQRGGRSTRTSAGSERSFEQSPLHSHAKVTGRGSGSPAWEGRSQDASHGNAGRSRLRPASRGNESPEKGVAVPKFGEWNENDPEAAENFTGIFNKVREERKTGAGNVPGTPKLPAHGQQIQHSHKPKKWWLPCV